MIPCVICRVGYSLDSGDLFLSTGVCRYCYRDGVAAPAHCWCFGKENEYDPADKDCTERCPDRTICKAVVEGKLVL